MPFREGNAPVPIVAWIGGVFDGEDPDVAWVYNAPFGKSEWRYGHSCFQAFNTSHPPASQTSVTISGGAVERRASGTSASVIDEPSGAWNRLKFSRSACVGARSASVTGRGYVPGRIQPGPYQNIGTSCVYGHGPA